MKRSPTQEHGRSAVVLSNVNNRSEERVCGRAAPEQHGHPFPHKRPRLFRQKHNATEMPRETLSPTTQSTLPPVGQGKLFAESRSPSSDDASDSKEPFGVPINGFHPQWASSPNFFLPVPTFCQRHLSTLDFHPSGIGDCVSNDRDSKANAKISEVMSILRREEERKRKRRRLVASQPSHTGVGLSRDGYRVDDTYDENATGAKPSSFSDLYDAVVVNSPVPQLIATSGGRVIAWNEDFLRITGLPPSQVSTSMTVFNLIRPNMLPKLFELFAVALRGGGGPIPAYSDGTLGSEEAQRMPSTLGDLTSAQKGFTNSVGSGAFVKRNGPCEPEKKPHSALDPKATKAGPISAEQEKIDPENSGEMYISMTLPCVRFQSPCPSGQTHPAGTATTPSTENLGVGQPPPESEAPLLITLTLMNDIDPNKRCFHCVLSEGELSSGREYCEDGSNDTCKDDTSLGEIRRIDTNELARLLCIA